MGTMDFQFYRYTPSSAAAATVAALFALITLYHLYMLLRTRTWYFIPFVIGGFCEVIGYVGRILSANETPNYTTGPYVMQSLLILIAPAFFAASIYMILGRIVRLVRGERHAIIRPGWLTKLFVSSDVLCFLLQGSGGGLLAVAKTPSAFQTGENIIIGGLFVQLVGFGLFLIVAALFHRRLIRDPTPVSNNSTVVPWRRFLVVLYAASACIFVRSVFRAIEYISGYSSSLQSTEFWLYIFDAALMLICMLVLAVFHPSQVVSARTVAAATAAAAAASGGASDLRGSANTEVGLAATSHKGPGGESALESDWEMQTPGRWADLEGGSRAAGLSGNGYYK